MTPDPLFERLFPLLRRYEEQLESEDVALPGGTFPWNATGRFESGNTIQTVRILDTCFRFLNILSAIDSRRKPVGKAWESFLRDTEPRPHRIAGEDPLQDRILAILRTAGNERRNRLLVREDFRAFFRQATPVDALEFIRCTPTNAPHGSPHLLKAGDPIWQISWSLSGIGFGGWFGVGTALARLERNRPDLWERLRSELPAMPKLERLLLAVQKCLCTVDDGIWHLYAGLAEPPVRASTILEDLRMELFLARGGLDELLGPTAKLRPRLDSEWLERRVRLRVLHSILVEQLDAWRRLDPGVEKERGILPILQTIAAITSGQGGI